MTLGQRRIIYLIFILIFLLITPFLILYTAGYRFNPKKNKIEKVGILFLTSKQREISIFLNNELYPKKLSKELYIKNLLPGEYEIKAEKKGYYPWKKKIIIQPEKTTFLRNIHLFKKNLPINLLNNEIEFITFSPPKGIYYKKLVNSFQEIAYYDIEKKKEKIYLRLPQKESSIKKLSLSPDKNQAIVVLENEKKEKTFLVLNFQDSKIFSLKRD